MVAVPYSYTTENLDFGRNYDRLPPHNIEAEEAILGGILLDPDAIGRVRDLLEPHHFYIGAHKDIYQACVRLDKKGKPTDLIHVRSYLKDSGLLERIGGANKLACLVDRTVSAVNIDHNANLVVKHAARRDVIKLGNKILSLGYEAETEFDEIIATVVEKANYFANIPIALTREERTKQAADILRKELIRINTTIPQPSDRLFELKLLTKQYPGWSIKDFDQFYFKSLVGDCGKPLTYQELKELAGSNIREWLQYGLVPVGSTILLSADGGVGKTKAAYNLAKAIIQGQPIGNFMPSGEKRKILFIQGDEQPGDIFESLEILGYSGEDIDQYVRIWTKWSFENMPALIQAIKEENFDFVIMDSLSTANRFSVYEESQMEYARPILELNALAVQYKISFLIIHHMNRAGLTRGTTAIRNAVSESWILKKDDSSTGSPYDRILEIDKSRSRSSGKQYKFFFDPVDLTFTWLGENSRVTDEHYSTKEQILQFLVEHRNIKYTTDDLSYQTGYSVNTVRKYAGDLSADGLISVERRPGQPNLYYLKYCKQLAQLSQSTGTELAQGDPKVPTSLYQTSNPVPESNTAKGDPGIKPWITSSVPNLNAHPESISGEGDPENAKNAKNFCGGGVDENCEKVEFLDHLSPKDAPSADLGLVQRERSTDLYLDQPDHPSDGLSAPSEPVADNTDSPQSDTDGTDQPKSSLIAEIRPTCPITGNPLQPPFEVKEQTPLGESIATVTARKWVRSKGEWAVRFQIDWTVNNAQVTKFFNFAGKPKALVEKVKELTHQWLHEALMDKNNRYKVRVLNPLTTILDDDDYMWFENCVMTAAPQHPVSAWYQFKTESGETIRVAGFQDFELTS